MATLLRSHKSPTGPDARLTPHSETPASQPLVLIAEDHEDTRFLLKTILEKRGLQVVEAVDGEEAIGIAESMRPGLVLMDGSLPRLDGFSATRRMRDTASLRDIPIIFLSGHAEPHFQRLAHDAGCDEYLVKPIDIAQLDRILGRYLFQKTQVALLTSH